MSKQLTEMLKGTLEGIVLSIIAETPAHGYEITTYLRNQGFSDIAEGTIYALLVRLERRGLVNVEKVPSEKGPPRKIYSPNDSGRKYIAEFWANWNFLTEQLNNLQPTGEESWPTALSNGSSETSARRSAGRRTRLE